MDYLQMKFDKAFNFVIISEGGTNNDPLDRGGLTNFGISQKQYPHLDIENITLDQARNIYYTDYWYKNKCYMMSSELAIVLFDSSVNCGQYAAAKWIQRACNKFGSNLVIDGIIGSRTCLEIIKYHPNSLLDLVISERLRRYIDLIEDYPEQIRFIKGWIRRVSFLLDYAQIVRLSNY